MDKVRFVNLLGSQISSSDSMLKVKWLNEIQLRYVATVTLCALRDQSRNDGKQNIPLINQAVSSQSGVQ